MNPFEKFIAQTAEHEMTRSKSIDFSNAASLPFQSRTQISSVSNAIANDPAQLANFLGHSTMQNKPTHKLETIYENIPTSNSNITIGNPLLNYKKIASNSHSEKISDQKSSEKKIPSIRGSLSSWKL